MTPTTSHDEHHEARLRAAFAAAREGNTAELDELRKTCEVCAMEALSLDRLSHLFDDEAELERDVRAAAATSKEALGADRVRTEPERLQRDEPRHSDSPSRLLPRAALIALSGAVAAGLLLFAGQRLLVPKDAIEGGPTRPAPRNEPTTLAAPVAMGSPTGTVGDFSQFTWSYELPVGGAFYLRVYNAAVPTGAAPLLNVGPLTSTSFKPNAIQRGILPSDIRWQIEALDLERNVVAHGAANATRR